MAAKQGASSTGESGSLKIGNSWNAITIIALSQNSPLKAIAEFVENSIDAKATHITIVRGKKQGEHYLKVMDDGEGIADFKYVATHIGDSIKRKLKSQGMEGIQGEFGIGLLSFWTVGEQLTMTSTLEGGETMRLRLVKNNPGYNILPVRSLIDRKGTELHIQPLLSGVRQLTGEKMQNYLASELRDRITTSGVTIRILDRSRRKDLIVEPRKFEGRLLHQLPVQKNPFGEIYCELYVNEPSPDNQIGVYKQGTRVLPSIAELDQFRTFPWNSGYLQGIIDASFLQLTPGTRDGIILDDQYQSFVTSLEPLSAELAAIVETEKNAEEEVASRQIFKRVRKALAEAILLLPQEEYNWMKVYAGTSAGKKGRSSIESVALREGEMPDMVVHDVSSAGPGLEGMGNPAEEMPGPLHKARIVPASSIVKVGDGKNLRLVAKDRKGSVIDGGLEVSWSIADGCGTLDTEEGEFVAFYAPDEPCVAEIRADITQDEVHLTAEARITVVDTLLSDDGQEGGKERKGLPSYTFKHAAGELWRSRFDEAQNLIFINNGHADYVYAAKTKIRKLRYIAKLYAKELVLTNFPGLDRELLLERLVELQLYVEENL